MAQDEPAIGMELEEQVRWVSCGSPTLASDQQQPIVGLPPTGPPSTGEPNLVVLNFNSPGVGESRLRFRSASTSDVQIQDVALNDIIP